MCISNVDVTVGEMIFQKIKYDYSDLRAHAVLFGQNWLSEDEFRNALEGKLTISMF